MKRRGGTLDMNRAFDIHSGQMLMVGVHTTIILVGQILCFGII